MLKRLIEVAFPLKEVSEHSTRESANQLGRRCGRVFRKEME